MSKRRKRRRQAFINRMNQILQDNPGMSIEKAKADTSVEVRKALLHADEVAATKEDHILAFEDALFKRRTIDQPAVAKKEVKTAAVEDSKPAAKAAPKKAPKAKKAKTITKAKKTTTTKAKKRTARKATKKAV
jgi:hypothetical protein